MKEKRKQASAHTGRKDEAIDRACEIVKGQGGGEVRIADKRGKFNDPIPRKALDIKSRLPRTGSR